MILWGLNNILHFNFKSKILLEHFCLNNCFFNLRGSFFWGISSLPIVLLCNRGSLLLARDNRWPWTSRILVITHSYRRFFRSFSAIWLGFSGTSESGQLFLRCWRHFFQLRKNSWSDDIKPLLFFLLDELCFWFFNRAGKAENRATRGAQMVDWRFIFMRHSGIWYIFV